MIDSPSASTFWIWSFAGSKANALRDASHRPSCVMPIGTTSYLLRSMALRIDSADLKDTSCSPDRPPKMTPTRILFIGEGLPAQQMRLSPHHCGRHRDA